MSAKGKKIKLYQLQVKNETFFLTLGEILLVLSQLKNHVVEIFKKEKKNAKA